MVNSYSYPMAYGQTNGAQSYWNTEQANYTMPEVVDFNTPQQQRSSSAPAVVAGVAVGGIGGSLLGLRKNPNISKNGAVSDTFVKNAYENYINKVPNAGKEAYTQGLEILKGLDKVKSMDELKGLLDKNSEAAQLVCAELKDGHEGFLESITHKNLRANKKTVKTKIDAGNKIRYQNMKNWIESCWDSEKKKLTRPDGMEKDVFKAIKKAANKGKGKVIAKYAAITAAIGGTIAFVANKFLAAKNNMPPQQFS